MHRKRKIEANRLRKNGLPVPSPTEPEVEEEEGRSFLKKNYVTGEG